MRLYKYRALRVDGSITEGSLDAANRQEACRLLETEGLKPVRLDEEKQAQSAEAAKKIKPVHQARKPSYRDLENFTRQLSSLLAAGVPLARSLQILTRESANPNAREHWKNIHDRVIDGVSLADAMAQSSGVFSRVYVAMVQAGETGGFLDVVLGQIADFQNRVKEMRAKVISALIYPCILMALAIAVLIFLLIFFIPRFQTIFSGFGAQLPLLTRIIIDASHMVLHYGLFLALGAGLVVLIVQQWLSTAQGQRAWETFLFRAPVVGPLMSRFAMTRFCRMLGTLVAAGVPLLNALRVARESLGNQLLIDTVSDLSERVKKGESLAASLSEYPQLFPGSVIEMITVAEETGKLDQELVRLAEVTDGELDRQLRTAVALAEPLTLFFMAAFIGTIFAGMVIPIFSIQDYIK